MAHKGSINEDVARDVPRFKSELEDIDFALYNFINDVMDLRVQTNKGFKKVPVIWTGAERAYNIKDTNIERDKTGMVKMPIISVERTGATKELKNKGFPYAAVDPRGDLKGGLITINRVIRQDKTSNFASADAFRRKKQLNYPIYKGKENSKIVYETITIPIPIYVDLTYDIKLRTEYQQQMNDLLTPFIRRAHGHKRVIITYNYNNYEAFIQEETKTENVISGYESKERKYETTITMNVLGYLIGDSKNQVQPRTVRRENPVQIRFARERIMMEDEDGEFRI
jgi:hypothetical protein